MLLLYKGNLVGLEFIPRFFVPTVTMPYACEVIMHDRQKCDAMQGGWRCGAPTAGERRERERERERERGGRQKDIKAPPRFFSLT